MDHDAQTLLWSQPQNTSSRAAAALAYECRVQSDKQRNITKQRLVVVGLTIEAAGDAQEAVITCVLGNPLAHNIGCQVVSREEHLKRT